MESLSVSEAAAVLRVSERTIYRLLDSGRLEASRVGNLWRIPPAALKAVAGRRLIEAREGIDEAAGIAIASVLDRVARVGFPRYFSEDDVNEDLAAELRARIRADTAELHHKLNVAGFRGRKYPDLSVIPTAPAGADRRGSPAYWSVETKFFSYRGDWGPYRLADGFFRNLLDAMEAQFRRLVDRRQAGLLGSGALIWVDAFDWRHRAAEDEREAVIAERAEWVRSWLSAPASRIRVDYLPMFHPQRSVNLLNGCPLPAAGPARARGSLRGAAVPFIKRMPPPDVDWDELVAQAPAEDWRRKTEE